MAWLFMDREGSLGESALTSRGGEKRPGIVDAIWSACTSIINGLTVENTSMAS